MSERILAFNVDSVYESEYEPARNFLDKAKRLGYEIVYISSKPAEILPKIKQWLVINSFPREKYLRRVSSYQSKPSALVVLRPTVTIETDLDSAFELATHGFKVFYIGSVKYESNRHNNITVFDDYEFLTEVFV